MPFKFWNNKKINWKNNTLNGTFYNDVNKLNHNKSCSDMLLFSCGWGGREGWTSVRAPMLPTPVLSRWFLVIILIQNLLGSPCEISGLEKNLNSSLPFGQVALKFRLPWASLRLLFLQFSWQMTCLSPCPLGKWEWKVTCPTGKSTCPGQLDGTFFEPWIYFLICLSTLF